MAGIDNGYLKNRLDTLYTPCREPFMRMYWAREVLEKWEIIVRDNCQRKRVEHGLACAPKYSQIRVKHSFLQLAFSNVMIIKRHVK